MTKTEVKNIIGFMNQKNPEIIAPDYEAESEIIDTVIDGSDIVDRTNESVKPVEKSPVRELHEELGRTRSVIPLIRL